MIATTVSFKILFKTSYISHLLFQEYFSLKRIFYFIYLFILYACVQKVH